MGWTRFLIGSTRRRDNPTLTLRRIPWTIACFLLTVTASRHGSRRFSPVSHLHFPRVTQWHFHDSRITSDTALNVRVTFPSCGGVLCSRWHGDAAGLCPTRNGLLPVPNMPLDASGRKSLSPLPCWRANTSAGDIYITLYRLYITLYRPYIDLYRSGKTSSLVRLHCIRRTKLLGANNSETEEMGKMGFSGYFGLLVIIAWLLGDFGS